ncbi:MAG: phage major capsid protein [Oscillospiraceae bacterium]|nr:phage major capsid protein [Oscillospiraceae bacterium]
MSFDTIRLEKGLYRTGQSFTRALEELDPSENYKGTSLEGLDAYQRQLKRFGIKVGGSQSSPVEKFFATTDSAALFPEYISRAVSQGIEEAETLPRIIATTTMIEGLDYRSISSAASEDEKELKIVAEGAHIPETTLSMQANLVKLRKRGRMLVASYEAIRFQKLDLFTIMLKQIGAYIARSQFDDAVSVLVNGDGNGNPAPVSSIADTTTHNITYSDLVNFWNLFSPYELNTIVAEPAVMTKLLNLPEFKDASAGMNFQGTGKMITPIGADLIKSPSVASGTLIGLDKSCALEMVKAGEVITEYDKLIDRQLERAAITATSGFAKIFTGASRVLNV